MALSNNPVVSSTAECCTLEPHPRRWPSARLLCAIACLLTSVVWVQALPAQIVRGTLIDDQTGQRIVEATVSLLTEDSVQVAEVQTDRSGTFVLRVIRPGSYRLRAECRGFVPVVSALMEMGQGDTIPVQIALSKRAVVLNAIVVKPQRRRRGSPLDDFYDRMERLPWGNFVALEEIERSHASRATDLLRRIPGVTLVRAAHSSGLNVILRGTCSPTVIINGTRAPLVGGGTIDDLVKPSTLEGIEVYRNAGDVPAEYGANVGCGAILLWTR
jgi:hypothetical protein